MHINLTSNAYQTLNVFEKQLDRKWGIPNTLAKDTRNIFSYPSTTKELHPFTTNKLVNNFKDIKCSLYPLAISKLL